MNKNKRTRINKTATIFARVTPAIADRLNEVAAMNGRRPSEEVRAMLVEYLDRHGDKLSQPERETMTA